MILGVLFGVILKPDGYTGQEWYEKQEAYLTDMETFASSLDDAVTLYLTGSIQEEDLLNYMGMFRDELTLMTYEYDQDLAEHPLETGTVENEDLIAADSVRKCYDVFAEVIAMIEENSDDPARLRYLYLGYHQVFNDAASGYFYVKLLEYYESQEESQVSVSSLESQ